MKNTIKSILAIVLVLCMLFTVAGCNDNEKVESEKVLAGDDFFTDTATKNETEEVQSNADATVSTDTPADKNQVVPEQNKIGGKTWKEVLANMPKKLRGTTITVWNWNPPAEYTGAPAVIDDFMKKTGIKVDWKTLDFGVYFTKLASTVASGEGIPDVVRTRGGDPEFLLNLQPISAAKYDFTDDAWDDNLMKAYTFGKNTYATSLKNTHIGSCVMMFYNKKLIADYEDPYTLWKEGKWTWSKYLEICRQYKKDTGKKASTGESMATPYITMYGLNGVYAYDGNRYFNSSNESKLVTVSQEVMDLFNKEALFQFGGRNLFESGDALFFVGGSVHIRRKNSYFGSLKDSNTVYAVPMPIPDGQTKYFQGMNEAEAYGIPKGASNPEAVPYFLRFFLDGELNKGNYGLNTYFVNEQNLEVYNWCMSQENRYLGATYGPIGDVNTGIQSLKGADVAQFLTANKGVIDKRVDELNKAVAILEK